VPEEEEGARWRSFRARMQNGEKSFNHPSHTDGTLMKASSEVTEGKLTVVCPEFLSAPLLL